MSIPSLFKLPKKQAKCAAENYNAQKYLETLSLKV
jgi:hypothetical protein